MDAKVKKAGQAKHTHTQFAVLFLLHKKNGDLYDLENKEQKEEKDVLKQADSSLLAYVFLSSEGQIRT